jgi:hypothetical protein
MRITRLLLFVLFLSLVLQNTCPYGFAAKTAFVATQTHDSPQSKNHHSPDKDRDSADNTLGRMLHPAFVLSLPDNQTIVLCSQMKAEYTTLSPENYKDFIKEPFTKPPVA